MSGETIHWLQCGCHEHAVSLSYWTDEDADQECYLSMWYAGKFWKESIWWRIGTAYRALRGRYHSDQVVLSIDDAKLLSKLLKDFSDGYVPNTPDDEGAKLRVILKGIENACLKQDRTSGWFNFAQSILIMSQQDLYPQPEEAFIGIDWACSKCEGKGWYTEQTPADYEGVYQCSCPDGKRALLDGSLSKAVEIALGKHKTEDPESDKKQ